MEAAWEKEGGSGKETFHLVRKKQHQRKLWQKKDVLVFHI